MHENKLNSKKIQKLFENVRNAYKDNKMDVMCPIGLVSYIRVQ